MISKETFIDTINFLDVMMKKEKRERETNLCIRNIFTLLFYVFPDHEKAKEEIEHYCFQTNFGKPSPEAEYESPGELYERLI